VGVTIPNIPWGSNLLGASCEALFSKAEEKAEEISSLMRATMRRRDELEPRRREAGKRNAYRRGKFCPFAP